LRIDGRNIHLTADAANGLIHVAVLGEGGRVLAESEPIAGDNTDVQIIWKQHQSLEHLIGRDLRLSFKITNATLYAFRFGGEPTTD
jgi:hypothetical protein